jgi:delta 1-pyrroline-5-carboxylate dehydrogenase
MSDSARRLLVGALVGLAVLTGSGAATQGPQAQSPQYLSFAEFAPDDSAVQRSVKQAYNDAVERYNKALYDYHVTLGQHDQLVDAYNRSGTPGEREKARADAVPLRARLQTLRNDVTALASAVDQARRKATQSGVIFTR